jgi:hypothetical protein
MASRSKPPVARGTVVKLRDSQGRAINARGIVMRNEPASDFSRAYGRQVVVCTFHGKKDRKVYVSSKGAGDLIPVGKVKKIPKSCREAVKQYEEDYPSKKRRR